MLNEDHKNAIGDARSAARAYAKDPPTETRSGLNPPGKRLSTSGQLQSGGNRATINSDRGMMSDGAIAWVFTAIFYAVLVVWIVHLLR